MTQVPTTVARSGVADGLRIWASGSNPMTAAAELLIRAFDGRFARADQPWIRVEDDGWVWLDDQVLHAHLGLVSGGEGRVLDLVCALIDSNRAIPLADTAVGIDRRHRDLVLAAFAHAAGSHEHSDVTDDPTTGRPRIARLGSVHPWPAAIASGSRRRTGERERHDATAD